MEDELNLFVEKIRKQMEKIEEEGGTENDNGEIWKKTLNDLNDAKKKIYSLGKFSENEEFKELKTEDIKFLLISFYQAELIQRFMQNRENMLLHSLQFYKEFFSILKKYEYLTKERIKTYENLTKEEDEEEKLNKKPSFDEIAKEREEKIQLFKYKKNLSEKIKVKFFHFIPENRKRKRL